MRILKSFRTNSFIIKSKDHQLSHTLDTCQYTYTLIALRLPLLHIPL